MRYKIHFQLIHELLNELLIIKIRIILIHLDLHLLGPIMFLWDSKMLFNRYLLEILSNSIIVE